MKVFISHSSRDKNFVRKLKKDLNDNLIETWLDEDEMFSGDDLMEKLAQGLIDSNYFLIILSPSAVNSDWVKFELENALNQIQNSTIEKIIPIKYRDCKVPESLRNLIYIDLSTDTVFTQSNQLEIYGNNYPEQLHRLVRALKQSQKRLTKFEIEELTGTQAAKNSGESVNKEFLFGIVGFASISRFLATYIPEFVKENYSKKSLSDFQPITLPNVLQIYFEDIKFGDVISITNQEGKSMQVDFAKFTSNNARIAIPKRVRDELGLPFKKTYIMTFDFRQLEIQVVQTEDE